MDNNSGTICSFLKEFSMTGGFIPPHGGYQKLLSFQKAEIVYDATVYFCDHFIDRRSRTHDQMVQAARSGKQNIVEGSMASGTSKEMEIKLTNVARASLEELLADYRDFLRTKGQPIWDKESKEAKYIRNLGKNKSYKSYKSPESHGTNRTNTTYVTYETYATYKPFVETRPPDVVANIIICLIHQTNYLLDRQLKQLEAAFLKEGGLRERMTRARLESRKKGHT
jgi:four helix bundle suffix protein